MSVTSPLTQHVSTPFPAPAESVVRSAMRKLIVLMLAAYALGMVAKGYDADELQSMIAGISIARGESLYVDVWDNHGPLLYYGLAALDALFPAQHHAVLLAARLPMLLALFLTVWLVHRLARSVRSDVSALPELACLVFLQSRVVFGAGFEIRPDVPFNLLWAASLVALLVSYSRKGVKWFFLSGAILGAGFLFSIKTLLLGAAAGCIFLVVMAYRRRILWRQMIAFGLGTAVAPLVMAGALWALGNLDAFWHSYYGQNADRAADSWEESFEKLMDWDPWQIPMLLASFLWAGWCACRRRLKEGAALAITAALAYYVMYYVVLPTHHRQSALPLMVPGAIAIAWFYTQMARHARVQALARTLGLASPRAVVGLLVVCSLLHLVDKHWLHWEGIDMIAEGEARARELGPGEMVFEGFGMPLYAPRAFPHKVYVTTLCNRIREGRLDVDIPAGLDRADVRHAFWDERVHRLGEPVLRFLGANYLPMKMDLKLAAGQFLEKPQGPASIGVRIAGDYYWCVVGNEKAALRVDGRAAPNPVALGDGPHLLGWQGGWLVLCVAPPEQWAELEKMSFWVAYATAAEYKRKGQKKNRDRIWPEDAP